MKRQILVGLSTLALSLVSAPAFASEVAAVNQQSVNIANQITPRNLVTRAYQGSFRSQGIPRAGALDFAARRGRVTAEDLVNVAIAQGRLAPETINDRGYLNNVESFLDNLDEN
ncbi:MAG: hypothetical protein ACFCAD_20735 [Pleurocapsa sp.]